MDVLLLNTILLIVSLIILTKSGDYFTDSACAIADTLHISRVIIGLTIVSFATTFPELAVSTMSAWIGSTGLAFGNAVGSVITNIGLILGFTAIVRPMRSERERFSEGLFMFGSAILVTFFVLSDGVLDRLEGIILITILVLFLTFILKRESNRKSTSLINDIKIHRRSLRRDVFLFILGAAGVIVGSRMLIHSGTNIALTLGVSETVIGLTLVALGTSLPELVTAIVSVYKKVMEVTLGNIIGASILNILWVLAVSAVINPVRVEFQACFISTSIMLIITLLLTICMKTSLMLSKKEGALLFVIYLIFIYLVVVAHII